MVRAVRGKELDVERKMMQTMKGSGRRSEKKRATEIPADGGSDCKNIKERREEADSDQLLTISNAAMFQRIMSEEDVCKGVVETILGIELEGIVYRNTEQSIEPGIDRKGVRLDAYVKGQSSAYDVEMQSYYRLGLGRRFRYYQSAVDTDLLSKGQDYGELPESYVIFICTCDPYGRGLARYSIDPSCKEDEALDTGFGCHWVALNARAYREAQSASLRNLLEYVDRGKVGDDPLVRLIAKRVDDANKDRKWVRKVFSGLSAEEDAWMQARIARREGMAEGMEKGMEEGAAQERIRYGKLVARLLSDGRTDDLSAAASDSGLLARLYEEHGL